MRSRKTTQAPPPPSTPAAHAVALQILATTPSVREGLEPSRRNSRHNAGYEQSPDYGDPEPTWRSIIRGSLLIAAGAIAALWRKRH
jgi:hypothetical protein